MKPKQFIVLVVILSVFAVLVVVKKVYRAQSVATESVAKLDIQFDRNQIQKVQLIKSEKNELVLTKEGAEWHLPSLWNSKASGEKVNQLFDAVSTLRGDLRANDSNVLSDFGLKDADGFNLVLSGETKTFLHLIVSFKVPERGGCFIKLKNSNAVYLIETNLFDLVGLYTDPKTSELKANFWADLQLLNVNTSNVDSFLLKEQGKGKEEVIFELKKKKTEAAAVSPYEESWLIEGKSLPFPIGPEKIYRYFGEVSEARAKEAVDPSKSYGLDVPDLVLSVHFVDGSDKTLKLKPVGEKTSHEYYAQASDQKTIFLVGDQILRSLKVDPSYFMSTTPFAGQANEWVSVRVKTVDSSIHLTKELGKDGKITWNVEGEQPGKIDQEKISTYLKDLQNFSIEEFLPDAGEKNLPKDIGNVWFELELKSKELFRIEMSAEANSEELQTAYRQGYLPLFHISKSTYEKVLQLPK